MTLGAEPKKVAAAAILVVAAALAMYTQVLAPVDAYPSRPTPAAETVKLPAIPGSPALDLPRRTAEAVRGGSARNLTRRRSGGSPAGEWVPTLKPRRPEDRPDPATVEPTLRTDLLDKLQTVTASGGHRSLFEFGSAAAAVPDVKITPKKAADKTAEEAKVAAAAAAAAAKATPPGKPAPPAIPLKYYGFVDGSGGKQAFFLNGEDIFAAAAGQMIQSRYRVLRIGLTSAEIEDVQHKHKQTIALEEAPAS